MATTAIVPFTGNPDIDGILYGVSWADSAVTFSFAPAQRFSGDQIVSVSTDTFSTEQKAAIRAILQSVSYLTSLSFVEVADTVSSQGTLRFGESATQVTASAYYPTTSPLGGDCWFNTVEYDAPRKGTYAYATFLHETGHALGLDHGHDGAQALPSSHDTLEYSVMTYRSHAGASLNGYTVREGSFPRSYMLNDLAALQYMYGANYATNAGNTTYRWSPGTGELSIDGVGQGAASTNTILETIWDGGGTDTYDFGAYTTNLSVNINPGGWTRTSVAQLAQLSADHVARGNIASAYLSNGNPASLIENVIGGSGNDWIVGNIAGNRLAGGRGSDTLYGLTGSDALKGGKGADHFVFSTALGAGNIDVIEDFRHNTDVIRLDDAIFAAIGSSLSKGEFYAKGGANKAHDSSDHIIYNTRNGKLFYDDDSKGGHASVHFATLNGKPTLDHGDFAIV